MKNQIKIYYFAYLREQLNCTEEELILPAEVTQISELFNYLQQRGGIWTEVFKKNTLILAAVNQELAHLHTPLHAGAEVGIFPPVSGG